MSDLVERLRKKHQPVVGLDVVERCGADLIKWPCDTAQLIAALDAQPVGLDGTETHCPIEGVHTHAFRGPHRFREWEPGT
jgi:hypothetical protein